MSHRLQWFIHLQTVSLRKRAERPDYTPYGAWHIYLLTGGIWLAALSQKAFEISRLKWVDFEAELTTSQWPSYSGVTGTENILLFMRKSHRRSWSFAILTYNTNSSTNSTKFTHLFTHNTNTANVTSSLLAQFQFTYIQEKYYLNKRKITQTHIFFTREYRQPKMWSIQRTDQLVCLSGDLEVTSQKCTIFYNIYNTRSQQICKTVQLLISCLCQKSTLLGVLPPPTPTADSALEHTGAWHS